MDNFSQIESLFFAALGKGTPEERAACLAEACGGDVELRRCLERLLEAHGKAGRFLEPPARAGRPGGGARADAGGGEQAGVVLAGRYRLLEPVGEGGMGTVWMAEQTEPVRRLVAVKLVRAGLDSRAVLARFEAERQALALMDHPHIARVLDAGTTGGEPGGVSPGRPYFVMELVRGVPVTKFCDEHRLTPRQRLELFIPVCQAVQHAHQKGVIHRDLKPSNILVALYDGRPVPKVIDFGLAKATGPRLTEETLHTGFGTVVGTVEYMSPEQASLDRLDVDTRSDVYSLGVLLYELLTGGPPFTRKELEGAGVLEMLRAIREQEPPAPSTRLSTAEGLPALAADRGTEPDRLTRLVRGELDWIVMKCLEKDRGRRYETANGLAQDLQRYLNDEPVLACPPSAAYRLRKFVRRNRAAVLTAALVLLTLVGGIVGTTWGLFRATEAEAVALSRAAAERIARDQAEEAKKEAVTNLQKAREAVDQMLTRVAEEKLRDVPQMELVRRNLLQDALRFYQEFVKQKSDDPRLRFGVAQAWTRLAELYASTDQNADAERAHHQSIAVLESLVAQFPKEPEYRDALRTSLQRLGNLLTWRFDREREAETAFRRALELQRQLVAEYPDSLHHRVDLAACESNVAIALSHAGNLVESEQGFRRALAILDRTGEKGGHPYHQAVALARLADVLVRAGRFSEAEESIRKSVALREAELAKWPRSENSRMNYAWGVTDLGSLLERTGRLREAEEAFRRSREVWQQIVTDFPDVLHHRAALARNLIVLGRLEARRADGDAASLYRQAWTAATEKVRPEVQPNDVWLRSIRESQRCLVECLSAGGRTAEVETHYRQALSLWESLVAQSPGVLYYHHELARTHALLACFLAATGRSAEAQGAYERAAVLIEGALKRQEAGPGPDQLDLVYGMFALAETCEAYGDLSRAEQLLRRTLAIRTKYRGSEDPQSAGSLALLGQNLSKQKRYAEAEPLLRECLTIREKRLPDQWPCFQAMSLLGESLSGQKKFAEAERLLLQGYLGMRARERTIPEEYRTARLSEAAGRLVQHYEAIGKHDEAAKWRKEREARGKPPAAR